jgi:hypothetical protein
MARIAIFMLTGIVIARRTFGHENHLFDISGSSARFLRLKKFNTQGHPSANGCKVASMKKGRIFEIRPPALLED